MIVLVDVDAEVLAGDDDGGGVEEAGVEALRMLHLALQRPQVLALLGVFRGEWRMN